MSYIARKFGKKTAWLTIRNPLKRNALNPDLCEEMTAAFAAAKKEKIPVVVIRAEKDAKTWSSGYDISLLPSGGADPLSYKSPLERVIRAINHYPGVVIAMVQGGVWGGACDIAVSCDMVIGDHSASFAITPVKIGLPYNASGISHFINRVGLNIAKEMFFTAMPLNAERAYHFGILNYLVSSAGLEKFTKEIAEKIAANSPLAIAVIKEQFRIISEAKPIKAQDFERIEELRREVFLSEDYREGIKSFLEKRRPKFKGK